MDFPAQPATHGNGIVALDPGWAMGTLPEADGRLRVGALTDEQGNFKELALQPSFVSQAQQVNRLQSIIAQETNDIMAKVQAWVDTHSDQSELRAYFERALLAHSNARRRQREAGGFRHLIKAVEIICVEIVPPERRPQPANLDDPCLKEGLLGWYKRFRHHDEWMRNLADQNDARKLHAYRNWAADAAKDYRTVVIDDSDLRKAAEAPAAEKDKAQVAGGQRQLAAPSLLITAFVNAFRSAGGELRWVIGKTSRTCSQCGHENPPLGAPREFTCERCGYKADREFNSGRNLIREHLNGHSTEDRQSTKVRVRRRLKK